MKALLLLLALCLTACAQFKPVRKPSRIQSDGSMVGRPMGMVAEEAEAMSRSPVIERRAQGYEKKGHPPAEARAMAEIEYLKTGL